MPDLKSWLRKYLGDNTRPVSPGRLPQVTEALNIRTPDGVIRAIEQTAKLDIPVTAAFFSRDIPSRYRRMADLIETIVGDKDTRLQNMSVLDLDRASPHIREAYQLLLGETYELAVLLQLTITLFGARDNIEMTRARWGDYLEIAEGHPDQADRIRIAKQQLKSLESTT